MPTAQSHPVKRATMADVAAHAKQAFERLNQTIILKLEESIQPIEDLNRKLQETLKNMEVRNIVQAEKALHYLLANINQKMESYKRAYQKFGFDDFTIDLESCFSEGKDKVRTLPAEVLTNVSECASTQYYSGTRFLSSAYKIKDAMTAEVNTIPETIERCTNLSVGTANTCLKGELAALSYKIIKEALPKIAELHTTLSQFVRNIQAKLQRCVATEIVEAGQYVTRIHEDFMRCVSENFRRDL